MYEFHPISKTNRPAVIGPVAKMLTERMIADFTEVNQTHSFAFYRRITLGSLATRTTIIQIPDDYYYFFHRFEAWYPLTQNLDESPAPEFKIYQVDRNREFSPEPINIRLQTSPAQQQAIRYRVDVNHVFLPAGKIKMEITPINATDPAYIDILTCGLRIPKDFVIQE